MSYTEYFDLIKRAQTSNTPYIIYTLDGVGAERKDKAFDFYNKSLSLMHKMLDKFLQLEKRLGKKLIVTDNIIKLLTEKQEDISYEFACNYNPNFTSGDLISFYFHRDIEVTLFKKVFYECAKEVQNYYTYHLAICPYGTNNYMQCGKLLWVGHAQQYLNATKTERICDLKLQTKENNKDNN